jgi:hypothetical protein
MPTLARHARTEAVPDLPLSAQAHTNTDAHTHAYAVCFCVLMWTQSPTHSPTCARTHRCADSDALFACGQAQAKMRIVQELESQLAAAQRRETEVAPSRTHAHALTAKQRYSHVRTRMYCTAARAHALLTAARSSSWLHPTAWLAPDRAPAPRCVWRMPTLARHARTEAIFEWPLSAQTRTNTDAHTHAYAVRVFVLLRTQPRAHTRGHADTRSD